MRKIMQFKPTHATRVEDWDTFRSDYAIPSSLPVSNLALLTASFTEMICSNLRVNGEVQTSGLSGRGLWERTLTLPSGIGMKCKTFDAGNVCTEVLISYCCLAIAEEPVGSGEGSGEESGSGEELGSGEGSGSEPTVDFTTTAQTTTTTACTGFPCDSGLFTPAPTNPAPLSK